MNLHRQLWFVPLSNTEAFRISSYKIFQWKNYWGRKWPKFSSKVSFWKIKSRTAANNINENPFKVIINGKWVTDNTVETVKTKTMTEYSSLVVIRSSKNEKIGQDQLVAFTRADKYDDFQIWRYKNSKWQNLDKCPLKILPNSGSP